MAKIRYDGPGDATLTGGAGKDKYRIVTRDLGPDTVWLSDPGGTNKLILRTTDRGFDGGQFLRDGDAVVWVTEKGGQVIFGGPAPGDATLAQVKWKTAAGTLEKLVLSLDPAPEAGKDWGVIGSAGADAITLPGSGRGAVTGQSVVWADGGNDTVATGPDQAALVFGGAGGDRIQTTGAAAGSFYGGPGDDILVGCGGKDTLSGDGGADLLVGCKSRDELWGGGGGDSLFGGTGKDRLHGGGGDDTLAGEDGRDRLWGDGGADVFAYSAAFDEGRDKLMDFEDGTDRIRIAGATFDDLDISGAGKGADTRIVLPSGTRLRIEDVAPGDITEADFLFV